MSNSNAYLNAVKFGKVTTSAPIERAYSFSSRFAEVLKEDNDTDSNTFFHAQDPSQAWSKRYFDALDLPETSKDEKRIKYSILHCIHNDFVSTATTYAKTIISEHYISDRKTLHPETSVGGRSGEKYFWHGIMFKFATSEGANNETFEGSDENAAKAMGHEIKGANSYIRTRIPSLCYALQCLVDYKGFRMHCQAKLDIDKTTLRVGSDDAGKIIKADDKYLLDQMKFAAQELNIREHTVKNVTLYAGVDCEGHKGRDDRYYIVDLARVFPPEKPGVLQDFGVRFPPLAVLHRVFYQTNSGTYDQRAVITRVYENGDPRRQETYYDVRFIPERTIVERVPESRLRRATQCIFWQFLRPEFVKSRGRTLLTKYPFAEVETRHLQQAIFEFANFYNSEADQREISSHAEIARLTSRQRSTSSNSLSHINTDSSAVTDAKLMTGLESKADCALGDTMEDSDDYSRTPYSDPPPVSWHSIEQTQLSNAKPFVTKHALAPSSSTTTIGADCTPLSATASWGSLIGSAPMSIMPTGVPGSVGIPSDSVADTAGALPPLFIPGDQTNAVPIGPSEVRKMTREQSNEGYWSLADQYTKPDISAAQQGLPESHDTNSAVPAAGAVAEANFSIAPTGSPRVTKKVSLPTGNERSISALGATPKRAAPLPLSSDAFSRFAGEGAEQSQRNKEVEVATEELLFEMVPAMAKDLLHHGHPFKRALISIADYMHYYGLNFRHGGYLRFVFLQEFLKKSELFTQSRPRRSSSAASNHSTVTSTSVEPETHEDNRLESRFHSIGSIQRPKRAASFDDLAGSTLARTNFKVKLATQTLGVVSPMPSTTTPTIERETSGETSGGQSTDSTNPRKVTISLVDIYEIQADLLQEVISRTLKCNLRETERDWMRSQKTESEQGLKKVIVQFLNVVSGSHVNSKKFWEETMPSEIVSRFGELSLMAIPHSLGSLLFESHEDFECDDVRLHAWMGSPTVIGSAKPNESFHKFRTLNLWNLISADSSFLHKVVDKLCQMTGIKLSSDCEKQRELFAETLKVQRHSIESEVIRSSSLGLPFFASSPRFGKPPSPVVVTPIGGRFSFSFDASGDKFGDKTIDDYAQVNAFGQSPVPATPPTANAKGGIFEDGQMMRVRSASSSGKYSNSGLRSAEKANNSGIPKPAPFKFVVADVEDIIPVVKHLHQLDFVTGAMLTLEAEQYCRRDEYVVATRILKTAIDALYRARRAVPDDLGTRRELADAYHLEATAIHKQRCLEESLLRELEARISRLKSEEFVDHHTAIKKLETQRENVQLSLQRSKIAAEAANRTYKHLHDIDAHTCCHHTRLSYRDDIIGIVIEVATKKWDFNPQVRERQYPQRKIVDVVIRPGCVSLSHYRKILEQEQEAANREAILRSGPRKHNQPVRLKNAPVRIRFLPLIIDHEHATRALSLLKEEILRTDRLFDYESPVSFDQTPVRIASELRIRPFSKEGLPTFDHEIGFRVISAIMCADVVNICRNATANGVRTFSADTAVGYLRLYHMLLYLAHNDPCNNWRQLADKTVRDFIEHPEKRSKEHTPNLGWFLIYLLLSRYSWDRVAVPFFEESLLRQVYWILNSSASGQTTNHFSPRPAPPPEVQEDESSYQSEDHDDLMSVSSFGGAGGFVTPRDQSPEPQRPSLNDNKFSPQLAVLDTDEIASHYRLFKTFEVTKLSSRIVLFQVFFLNMTSGRYNFPWTDLDVDSSEQMKLRMQEEDLQLYNSSLGFPTGMVRSDMIDEFQKILSIADYEGLLQRLHLLYTPGQMAVFLRNAIRRNISTVKREYDFSALGNEELESDEPFILEQPILSLDDLFDESAEEIIRQQMFDNWRQQWQRARDFYSDELKSGTIAQKLKEWVAKAELSRQQQAEINEKFSVSMKMNKSNTKPAMYSSHGRNPTWSNQAKTPRWTRGGGSQKAAGWKASAGVAKSSTRLYLGPENLSNVAAGSAPPPAASSPLWAKARDSFAQTQAADSSLGINSSKQSNPASGIGIADSFKALSRTYSNVTSTGVSSTESLALSRTNSHISILAGLDGSAGIRSSAPQDITGAAQHSLSRTASNMSVTSVISSASSSSAAIPLSPQWAPQSSGVASSKSFSFPAELSPKMQNRKQVLPYSMPQLKLQASNPRVGKSMSPASEQNRYASQKRIPAASGLSPNYSQLVNSNGSAAVDIDTISSSSEQSLLTQELTDAADGKVGRTRSHRSGSIGSNGSIGSKHSIHSCPDNYPATINCQAHAKPTACISSSVSSRIRSNSLGDGLPTPPAYLQSRANGGRMPQLTVDGPVAGGLRADAPSFTPRSQRSFSVSSNSDASVCSGTENPIDQIPGRRQKARIAGQPARRILRRETDTSLDEELFPCLPSVNSTGSADYDFDNSIESCGNNVQQMSVGVESNKAALVAATSSWVSVVARAGLDANTSFISPNQVSDNDSNMTVQEITESQRTVAHNGCSQSLILQALEDNVSDIPPQSRSSETRDLRSGRYRKGSTSNDDREAVAEESKTGTITRRRSDSAPFPVMYDHHRANREPETTVVSGLDLSGDSRYGLVEEIGADGDDWSVHRRQPRPSGSGVTKRSGGRFGGSRAGGRGGRGNYRGGRY